MARKKRNHPWLESLRLVLLDLLTLLFCGITSNSLRGFGENLFISNLSIWSAVVIALICLIGLSFVGGYEGRRNMATLRYMSEHILAMGAVLLFTFTFTYAFSTYNESIKPGRSIVFGTLALFTPLSLVYRYFLSRIANRRAAVRSIYVIGHPQLLASLQAVCEEAKFRHPLRFIELTATNVTSVKDEVARLLAYDEDHPNRNAHLSPCEGVVVDLAESPMNDEWMAWLLRLNFHSVPVYPVESFLETYFYKVDLAHVSLSWALDSSFKSDYHTAYEKIKSLIDIFLSAFLFLLFLPLMALVCVLIKVVDEAPALFTQTRVGRFERPFLLYKFRTMKDVDTGEGDLYTQKNDPRITRLGRFLRLTRLDELPQLWNVLNGDMSLIGPRAEWDKLVQRYGQEIPYYHLRHLVKPGITGWAQVHYGYGADVRDTREKLQYDLFYIKHYSLQMDAAIILKTIFTMLSASGR
jgi:exopolysaccharide biosynthesis polyprenyl glycosylphosphotransferase